MVGRASILSHHRPFPAIFEQLAQEKLVDLVLFPKCLFGFPQQDGRGKRNGHAVHHDRTDQALG